MRLKCPNCGEYSEYKEISGTIKCKECGIHFTISKREPFYHRGEAGVLNSSLYSSYPKKRVNVEKEESE